MYDLISIMYIPTYAINVRPYIYYVYTYIYTYPLVYMKIEQLVALDFMILSLLAVSINQVLFSISL